MERVISDGEQEEIELYTTSKERQHYDDQANLYSIILATEHLERAYARDCITQKEVSRRVCCSARTSRDYSQCLMSLAIYFHIVHYRMQQAHFTVSACRKGRSEGYQGRVSSLCIFPVVYCMFRFTNHSSQHHCFCRDFMALYQMDCPRATERLLRMGVPEPMKNADSNTTVAVTVAETVQHFITTMDAVKLEQRAVDELQPLLSDLMDSMTRLPETPNDFEPNRKVRKWLQKLNAMRAVDQIDEDDARQLYHDLDSAYAEFTRYLKRH